MNFFKQLKESLVFAVGSLKANKMRTFLSLLGITIGIFAIISVFTVIDSLERSIRNSIESLGNNVVYVQKWPWEFSEDYPWWKYLNRPVPTIREMEELRRRSQKAEAVAFMIATSKLIQYKDNSIDNATIIAASDDYDRIRSFEIESGRYFSFFELKSGYNKVIIGTEIAKNLFGSANPIGKEIKISGKRFSVIGLFKKEGKDLFENSNDNAVLLPLNYARNILDVRSDRLDPVMLVKARDGVSTAELTDELRGIMRAIRRLRPAEEENFALNQASMISKGFDAVFSTIDMAGIFIGGFSILVGGFGIANIMFVSVKERTKLIGIQKSLGAKNYFILYQFLYEAVILSLIGGIVGLILVYTGTVLATRLVDMEFTMSFNNVASGLVISVIVGLLSGIIPALAASRLNPVEAINSNF
jgi:putative ABC transport system permease protein